MPRQIILVTGASSGFGLMAAQALAEADELLRQADRQTHDCEQRRPRGPRHLLHRECGRTAPRSRLTLHPGICDVARFQGLKALNSRPAMPR
jgi:NAD(P)-dependent dehydrogenase (short-subunit alcohol dehydrogenase family)